jgi:chromosome partitioning protein
MSKIITISNHKGGVGKTTSVLNIGAGLSKLGKRVLLIDIDPQSNLTMSLGISNPEFNIYGAIKGDYPLKPITVTKKLDIIPSVLGLLGAEIELNNDYKNRFILKNLIKPIQDNYDYILIDCPPSLGLLTINSFTVAQDVYITLQPQFFALQGLSKLTEVIEEIQKTLNPDLKIGGVIITLWDSRKVLHRDVTETAIEHFKEIVFKTKIRENIAIAEAQTQGVDIFRYQPNSKGAEDYSKLCKEIIKR